MGKLSQKPQTSTVNNTDKFIYNRGQLTQQISVHDFLTSRGIIDSTALQAQVDENTADIASILSDIAYVSSLADLPAVASGEIQLEDNTTYIFTDLVQVTDVDIVTGINNVLKGESVEDGFFFFGTARLRVEASSQTNFAMYTMSIVGNFDNDERLVECVTGNVLFFTMVSCTMVDNTLSANASVQINGPAYVNIHDCDFATFAQADGVNLQTIGGITAKIADCRFLSGNGNNFVNIGGKWDAITISSNQFIMNSASDVGVNGLAANANFNDVNGRGLVNNNVFVKVGGVAATPINNILDTDAQWWVKDNAI